MHLNISLLNTRDVQKIIDTVLIIDENHKMDYKENMTYLRELWVVYSEHMHSVISLRPYYINLMNNLVTIVKYHADIVNYSYFASNHVNHNVYDNIFPSFSETDNLYCIAGDYKCKNKYFM